MLLTSSALRVVIAAVEAELFALVKLPVATLELVELVWVRPFAVLATVLLAGTIVVVGVWHVNAKTLWECADGSVGAT